MNLFFEFDSTFIDSLVKLTRKGGQVNIFFCNVKELKANRDSKDNTNRRVP